MSQGAHGAGYILTRRTQILLIGHNDNGCLDSHRNIAYETGRLVAERGAVLVTGGMGGVMEAAAMGAREAGGISVGIIPHKDPAAANPYCDVVIPTGIGLMRDFVNVHAAHGIIIVGGGAGTLSEMCAAYMYRKPMVAIRGTGGMADRFAGQYLDHRQGVLTESAGSAAEAVERIFEIIST